MKFIVPSQLARDLTTYYQTQDFWVINGSIARFCYGLKHKDGKELALKEREFLEDVVSVIDVAVENDIKLTFTEDYKFPYLKIVGEDKKRLTVEQIKQIAQEC